MSTDDARAALLGTDTEEGALDLDRPAGDGTPYFEGIVEGYNRAVEVVIATLDRLAADRAETTTEDREYPSCYPSLGEMCGNCHRCTETTTGAIARGEALAAGDPDWMNVTRWPQDETTTALPRPGNGCQCTWHNEDRGGGHYELVAEYEPACPEHSEHVWNPRTGMWEHRAEMTTATTEDAAQVIESTRHYNGSRSFIVPADAARALMDAGLLASSSPARTDPTETTTEWGVTNLHADGVLYWTTDEHAARTDAAREGRRLVRREVTAWTEADQ